MTVKIPFNVIHHFQFFLCIVRVPVKQSVEFCCYESYPVPGLLFSDENEEVI